MLYKRNKVTFFAVIKCITELFILYTKIVKVKRKYNLLLREHDKEK